MMKEDMDIDLQVNKMTWFVASSIAGGNGGEIVS
jgi:hypothetical protein